MTTVVVDVIDAGYYNHRWFGMKVAASEMLISHCGEAPPSPLFVFQPPGWSNDFLKLQAGKLQIASFSIDCASRSF